MRNLIILLRQFQTFFLFLLLEIICFYIILSNNNYQQSSYFNSARHMSASLLSRKQRMVDFIHLHRINDSLASENARLRQQLGIIEIENPLHDTSIIASSPRDTIKVDHKYSYLSAKVINNIVDQKRNYITLDKGQKDGVQKNHAVITPQGVVGKISHVSEHYSVAVSIISDRFNLSAMVKDGNMGRVFWDGKHTNQLVLSGISQSVKLKVNDSVYTSGYSDHIPQNILIGKVLKSTGPNTYLLRTAVNFKNVHYVYIISETISEEKKQIELIATENE